MASSAPRARTYSISKADMEASRLVFVFVRDAKPKRKVAVPVPDGYTWDEFIQQVKQKLKIVGVKEVQLVSTGQRVTSLDELQDIDELCVTEGLESVRSNSVATSPMMSQPPLAAGLTHGNGTAEIQVAVTDRQFSGVQPSNSSAAHGSSSMQADSDDQKYARRAHPLRRLLQKWLPSVFTPTLPVTTRDLASHDSEKPGEVLRKRRKQRRGAMTIRSLLLVLAAATCVLTMLWFLFRTTPTISR